MAKISVYLNTDTYSEKVLRKRAVRSRRATPLDLALCTRVVLKLYSQDDTYVAEVDTDDAPLLTIDYTQSAGTGHMLFRLGTYLPTLLDADGAAAVPAGHYLGRLILYGTFEGLLYDDGLVFADGIHVPVHD